VLFKNTGLYRTYYSKRNNEQEQRRYEDKEQMTNVNEHFSCFLLPKPFALSPLVSCHVLQQSLSVELPTLWMLLSAHASQALPVPQKELARWIGDSKQQLALSKGKN
jgi:hypothetical protein